LNHCGSCVRQISRKATRRGQRGQSCPGVVFAGLAVASAFALVLDGEGIGPIHRR
jgi:hypothetical protein